MGGGCHARDGGSEATGVALDGGQPYGKKSVSDDDSGYFAEAEDQITSILDDECIPVDYKSLISSDLPFIFLASTFLTFSMFFHKYAISMAYLYGKEEKRNRYSANHDCHYSIGGGLSFCLSSNWDVWEKSCRSSGTARQASNRTLIK